MKPNHANGEVSKHSAVATQAPGMPDILRQLGKRSPAESLGTNAQNGLWVAFLQAFDRNRRERVCEREENHTLLQTLEMISGDTVNEKIRSSPFLNRLADSPVTGRDAIEQIFLRAFSRKPEPEELDSILSLLTPGKSRRKEFEDILWSALNSKEFMFNH